MVDKPHEEVPISSSSDLPAILRRIIDAASMSANRLAEEAGVTWATLYAWSRGRRNPKGENLARLADVLEHRGDELRGLAEELRREVGD